jgi:hypothetical protein
MYTYPDGTQTQNRPVDGQIFYTWDWNGDPIGIWQWDDYLDRWCDITHINNMPTSKNLGTAHNSNTGTYTIPTSGNYSINGKTQHYDAGDSFTWYPETNKCECGAEKTGSNKHSTWCPKYRG